MSISRPALATLLKKLSEANKQGLEKLESAKSRGNMDYFTLSGLSQSFLALKTLIERIQFYKGEKGEPGESIVGPRGPKGEDGESIVGPKGDPGKDGKNGKDADMTEALLIADKEVKEHEKKYDHKNIHDPKVLGSKEVDESNVGEGKILQVEGKKLVYRELPNTEKRMQSYVVSQGVSNVRSFSVTASREADAMGLYIVDATSGNITITIPSAAGRENTWYEFIRIDSSSNTVTISPTGSETMSGMTSYVMQQWTDVKIFAYNGNYLIRQAS